MGKFKSIWNALFSSEPVLTDYQPDNTVKTHYRGWCVDAGRHFHIHVVKVNVHTVGKRNIVASVYRYSIW